MDLMFLVKLGYDIDEIGVEVDRLGQRYPRPFAVRPVEDEGVEDDFLAGQGSVSGELLSAA